MMWLAIVGVGLGSYLLRVIPLVVLPRVSVPPSFDRVVRHAGLAAVTALLVASISGQAGGDLRPTLVAVRGRIGARDPGCVDAVRRVGRRARLRGRPAGVERGRLTIRADVCR